MPDDPYASRFQFLFDDPLPLRFKLCSPDLLEPRWSVWDCRSRSTLAFGQTAEAAVDAAVEIWCRRNSTAPSA